MSYASFLKSVPEILSQPTGIAALASLGIHGAIAFLLPLMPVESSKSNKQAISTTTKPVGLSELSSNEQSRIPQKSPTTQPGVQSQIPPLPNQITGLPSQQQIPSNLPGSSTPLPPAPPAGSTSSLVPPGGSSSNSSAFAPLEKASGFNVARMPKGSNPVQSFRNNFNPNPSKYSSTPMMSSRITPRLSSGTNRNNSDLEYSRQKLAASRPERLAEAPNSVPANVPVYPQSSSPAVDMAAPPIGETGNNYNNLNNNTNAAQPGNENRVEPNRGYIAPVEQNQTSNNRDFKISNSGTPLPTYQPQSGSALDNLNRPSSTLGASGTTTGSTAPLGNIQQNTQSNINNPASEAKIYGDFKKEFPQGQLRVPINLPIDQAKLDSNAKVSLIMNGENKISDLKLLGDAAKLPFPKQQAIRERLQQYFKENPTSTNGKGALFSFTLLPGQANLSQSNGTATGALQNNQTPQIAPQATTSIMGRLSGSNSTQTPVPPPQLSEPVNTALPQGQTVVPKLPLQKPASPNDLPQSLNNVQPASQAQNPTTTASQPSKNALVTKLRNTQSRESEQEMSVVEKLRKVKQQRENANRENP